MSANERFFTTKHGGVARGAEVLVPSVAPALQCKLGWVLLRIIRERRFAVGAEGRSLVDGESFGDGMHRTRCAE